MRRTAFLSLSHYLTYIPFFRRPSIPTKWFPSRWTTSVRWYAPSELHEPPRTRRSWRSTRHERSSARYGRTTTRYGRTASRDEWSSWHGWRTFSFKWKWSSCTSRSTQDDGWWKIMVFYGSLHLRCSVSGQKFRSLPFCFVSLLHHKILMVFIMIS